ncbi:MAG: hypothetical protein GY832_02105 [Chloroflexi bacterium]|nr:hypothetical protein [Chloroflexota bacterium]
MSCRRGRCILAVVTLMGLLLVSQAAVAGTITITKCKMTDKTNSTEVTSGYADADLSVAFKGAATCTCEAPDLTYTWHFGDGDSANGAAVSHAYSGAKAGNRSPYLHVDCNACGADKDSSNLSVHAISGINVTQVGNSMRLCFDAVRNVAASALPAGVSGSNKIDWHVLIGTADVDLANSNSGTMPSPSPWPTSNSSWGAKTLYVSIDGPHVAGQQGELNLTGTASFVDNDQSVKVFFDETGTQNPNGSQPNWFYYWKQTSAYSGTMGYDSSVPSGRTRFENGAWRCYLGVGAHFSAAGGCWGGASGIDFFANLCRHESQHRSDLIANWGANSGHDPAHDQDGDNLHDDMEATLVSGHVYDNQDATTYNDTFGYTDTPGDPLLDVEDYCLRRQASWTAGSANSADWAHPGKQWP